MTGDQAGRTRTAPGLELRIEPGRGPGRGAGPGDDARTAAAVGSMARQLVALAVLLAGVLLVVALLARSADLTLSFLTRDPGALGRLPWYAGALSQLTVLLWASAATGLLLAARIAARGRRRAGLLLGLLAAVLAADDAFQLHEGAAGVIPGSDLTVVVVYGLAAPVALLLVWRSYGREVLVPLLGVVALGVSAVADLAELGAAVEDTPKLAAAALWTLCGVRLLGREASRR